MDIRAKIRQLAEEGHGRTTITREVPEASEWLIRKIIADVTRSKAVKPVAKSKPKKKTNYDIVTELSPIQINVPKKSAALSKKNLDELYTVIVLGDVQAPFHCDKAVDIACQVISVQRKIRLDRVVHLGDHFDFYSASDYDKSPLRRNQLQDELVVGAEVLARITEAAQDTPKDFIPGNHEHRLMRYVSNNAPALAALPQLQLGAITGLDSAGWQIHDGLLFLHDRFVIKHGHYVAQASGASSKKEMDKAWASGASGHVHRLGLHYRTPLINAIKGKSPEVWIETGCLCKPDQDYLRGNHPDWQQGLAVIRFDDRGNVYPELITIHEGTTVFQGKVLEANI